LLLCRKDGERDAVDFGADPLENIGGAVDDRVQQFHQHQLAVHRCRAGAGKLVGHDGDQRGWS